VKQRCVAFDGAVLAAGPVTGVAGSFLATLRAYARASDARCVLLVPPAAEAPEIPGVEIAAGPSGRVARQRLLPPLLRRIGADLLHCPVAAVPLRAPCPVIATVHDLPWRARPKLAEPGCGALHRLAVRLAVRRAAAIVVPTGATAADLARAAGAAPVRVIPHGVAAPAAPADAAALVGPFLVLGDDRPRKNHPRVRAAWTRARELAPDLPELRFVGPHLGYAREDEKIAALREARALLHFALHEGFGLPIAEAFAHGVPVACADIASLREVADGAALLAPPTDVEALAAAMVRVHRDEPLRARLRAAGLARARQLTPEASAAGWQRLHDEILARGSGAGRARTIAPPGAHRSETETPLHVAVAGWLLPLGHSGANRRLRELLRAAAPQLRTGERITLLAPPDVPPIPGIEVHPIAIPPAPAWRRARAEQRLLPRALAEIGATVLDLATLPVPARLPCPTCLTIHDLRDLGPMRRRPRALARWTLVRSAARAAHLIVPSDFTARELARALATLQPITVVRGGVDDAFFAPASPAQAPAYFLHVGHLEPRKNLFLLLDAYARVCARVGRPAPALVLAGADAGSGAALRARADALGLGARVQMRGRIDDHTLRALYAGATAVLLPSLHEGFGLPALEGLAAGVPVLVSDRGALPEVVGPAGVVLPAHDAEAWADAMARVTWSPGDADARRAHARSFRWSDAAARLLHAWRVTSAARR
jgi:glycosyltransferase involved in cell wall biosynthesis